MLNTGELRYRSPRYADAESVMKRRTLVLLSLIAALGIGTPHRSDAAQQPPPPALQDGQLIPLWAGPAPGALGTDEADIPAVTVFLPRQMTPGTPAVIVCPGGGYTRFATNHEGRQVAGFLNSLGVAAFGTAIEARTALSPSRGARRCAACDQAGAGTRRVVEHRCGTNRCHGILGRRSSRNDSKHDRRCGECRRVRSS